MPHLRLGLLGTPPKDSSSVTPTPCLWPGAVILARETPDLWLGLRVPRERWEATAEHLVPFYLLLARDIQSRPRTPLRALPPIASKADPSTLSPASVYFLTRVGFWKHPLFLLPQL